MRFSLFSRPTKKYLRIVIVFIAMYSVVQFSVLKNTTMLTPFTVFGNRSVDIKDIISGLIFSVKKKDIVIYSEDEVQIQLKGIHELGKTIISLNDDKCIQRLPECIIIGNFKCGTQELLEFIRIRIYREPYYELHFFTGNYFRGSEWYRKQMPCSYNGQITIEKTPDYFQDAQAPNRIRQMNPKMKLIAMVRDPVERALSHFSFSNNSAKPYGYNFEKCAFNSNGINKNCFAIKHSIYDEGIKRYFGLFNKSQIMIINNDDFKKDPFTVLHDIETFLGIEHVIDRKYFAYIEEKGFHCVRSPLNETLVACYDRRRGRKEGPRLSINTISNVTLKRLNEFFKPHNEIFFQEIGRTYDWQSNM